MVGMGMEIGAAVNPFRLRAQEYFSTMLHLTFLRFTKVIRYHHSDLPKLWDVATAQVWVCDA
jgi:hypothetical protein